MLISSLEMTALARLPPLLAPLVLSLHSLRLHALCGRFTRYLPCISHSHSATRPKRISTYLMEVNNAVTLEVASDSSSAKRPLSEEPGDVATPSEKKPKLCDGDEVEDQGKLVEQQAGEGSTVPEAEVPLEEKKKQSRKAARDKRNNEKDQRKRRGTRPDGEAAPDTGEPKAARLPKRMSAMLLGFCGAGYCGMQVYVTNSYRLCLTC